MHHIAEDADAVAVEAAHWIAEAIRSTVRSKPGCAMALPGGRTPREAYHRLAALPNVPWSRVEIFFTDERAVSPDSPDSNYHLALDALLTRVPIPATSVHRMEAERNDLTAVAREYEAILPESLDVLVLGVGADGHTASLFPHAPALGVRDRLVVPVVGGEPLVQRLTITPPVIERSARILVIAVGAAKAGAVALALEGPEDAVSVPAQLARSGTWIIDRAAAQALRG